MSQDKEIIKKLFSVIAKQQQIITKLAQSVEAVPAQAAPATPADATETLQGVLLQITGGKGGFSVANARGPLSDGSVRVQMKVPANHPQTDQVIAAFKAKVAQIPGFDKSRVEVTKLV